MPQRNAQNPTRQVKSFDRSFSGNFNGQGNKSKTMGIAGIRSACKTEIPLKPGFRPSSLTCPKCNRPIAKK